MEPSIDPQQLKWIEIISRNAQLANRLIEDLLKQNDQHVVLSPFVDALGTLEIIPRLALAPSLTLKTSRSFSQTTVTALQKKTSLL